MPKTLREIIEGMEHVESNYSSGQGPGRYQCIQGCLKCRLLAACAEVEKTDLVQLLNERAKVSPYPSFYQSSNQAYKEAADMVVEWLAARQGQEDALIEATLNRAFKDIKWRFRHREPSDGAWIEHQNVVHEVLRAITPASVREALAKEGK